MPEQPILWSFRRCPYAMRARLALKSSQTNVLLREIVLRDKPEEFLKASAKGTVPVLVMQDGLVLEESRDIMLWALHKNDPENWLDVCTAPSMLCVHNITSYVGTNFFSRGRFENKLRKIENNVGTQL